MLGEARHSGRGRDLNLRLHEGVTDRFERLLREQEGTVLIHLREHHGELLASGARNDVHQTGPLLEQARQAEQDLIAGRNTVALVDLVEAVEIDHDHAHRPTVRSRALELALDGLMQRNTIRKPGESICSGRIGQPAEQALDAGPQVGEQRRGGDQGPGGDHEVADRRVLSPGRDRRDRDREGVVESRPDDVASGVEPREREVEDVEADPQVHQRVAADRVAAEDHGGGREHGRAGGAEPHEPDRHPARREEHEQGPARRGALNQKQARDVEVGGVRQNGGERAGYGRPRGEISLRQGDRALRSGAGEQAVGRVRTQAAITALAARTLLEGRNHASHCD